MKKKTTLTTILREAHPANKWTSRCPAVIFAISRKPRARGRIKVLATSIKTRAGAKAIGAPKGMKWAISSLGPRKKV